MSEFIYPIIVSTILVLLITVFAIAVLLIHSRRQQAHKLEKATMESNFNNEILTARNEVQEETMKQIAQEIHDNVGQLLSLVKIQLNNIEDENPGIKRVGDSKDYLNQALGDLRSLSKTLDGDNILNAGLVKAIAFELIRVMKTGHLITEFQYKSETVKITPKTEVIVFRMFQEILQNVLKHANAKKLVVSLHENQEVYTLQLADDGDGFEVEKAFNSKGLNTGSGLNNLKHRADLLGGEIHFESGPGQGTQIKLTIPKYHLTNDKGSSS